MMANKYTVKKDRVKEIFENMEYDKDVKEGWELASAWIHKQKNKFVSSPDITKESVAIQTSSFGGCNVNIVVNKITDDNTQQLIKECEAGLKEWNNLNDLQKAKLFNKVPSEIEKYSSLVCQLEMKIRNIFSKDTKNLSISTFTEYFQYYAGWASVKNKKIVNYNSYGICVISLSQRTPLALLGMVLAPCLAAGNAIILSIEKELIPISFLIKEFLINTGFPTDIIKIVNGSLQSILKHESIGKLTYIGDLFAENYTNLVIKKQISLNTLHLGKAAMIVFDSGDLDSSSDAVVDIAMGYRGYYPWSLNRIYVQESVFKTFEAKLKNIYINICKADSSSYKNVDVITDTFLDIKFGYKTAGSNIVLNHENNYLNILPFRTASEGIALLNNTRLGLAASVWTDNVNLVNEIVSKLKVSTIWINNHGLINAGYTISPYKKSGKGYFGGREGFFEYLKFSNKINHMEKITNHGEHDIMGHLPIASNKKHTYLYYGGAFKKSESGLIENNSEYPNRKDVRNCVEVALKSQDGWNKLSNKDRGQHLRKFADNSAAIQNSSSSVNVWVESLYEWASISSSMMSLNVGFPAITSAKEPYGVIAMELFSDCEVNGLQLIVGALSCGNAVIIVNKSVEDNFLMDVCSKCTLPAGVFNVINYPNEEVINTLKSHQEVQAYFTVQENNEINIASQHVIHDISNIDVNSTESVFNSFTRTKNIWNSAEESFL